MRTPPGWGSPRRRHEPTIIDDLLAAAMDSDASHAWQEAFDHLAAMGAELGLDGAGLEMLAENGMVIAAACGDGDFDRAAELAHRAVEMGATCGDKDLQAFGLVGRGSADPQPGRPPLYLAQGPLDAAVGSIERALAGAPTDRLGRARLLPAQVDALLAGGSMDGARVAAAELSEIAEAFGSAALRAAAHRAMGRDDAVYVAAGEPDLALRALSISPTLADR
jgi:hypothetical protein